MKKNIFLDYVSSIEKKILGKVTQYKPEDLIFAGDVITVPKHHWPRSRFHQAVHARECSREVSSVKKMYSLEKFFELLRIALGVRKRTQTIHYMTPVAGGVRELRYIFCIRSVRGLTSGFWEYVPEMEQLRKLQVCSQNFSRLFCEEWERRAAFNLLLCFPIVGALRQYKNNALHCTFEAGCVVQLLQMQVAMQGRKSCISGFVNRAELNKILPKNGLFPAYAFSLF